MTWPAPEPSGDLHILQSPDVHRAHGRDCGRVYVKGIDASGRACTTSDREQAWKVSRTYAFRIKSAYQLRSYKVVPFDT